VAYVAPEGEFNRDTNYITTRITADGRDGYPVEPDRYRLIAPDYPGFGHSAAPAPSAFSYTFDHIADVMVRFTEELGHVDGFYQDEAEGEGDDAGETLGCFLAAKGDAFEALQLAEGLLDARTFLIQELGEERWPVLGVGAGRNDGADRTLA